MAWKLRRKRKVVFISVMFIKYRQCWKVVSLPGSTPFFWVIFVYQLTLLTLCSVQRMFDFSLHGSNIWFMNDSKLTLKNWIINYNKDSIFTGILNLVLGSSCKVKFHYKICPTTTTGIWFICCCWIMVLLTVLQL